MAKITLHGIGREIKKVRGALKKARPAAPQPHQKKIDLHLRKLDKLEAQTQSICARAWTLWPMKK